MPASRREQGAEPSGTSPQHPVHSLEDWLTVGHHGAGAGSTTVLGRMAFNHSQRRAAMLSVYIWSGAVGIAGLIALTTGFSGTFGWVLPAVAVALLLCGIGLQVRLRARPLPQHRRLTSSRSPVTIRGAVLSSVVLAIGVLALTTMLLVRSTTPVGEVAAGCAIAVGFVLVMSAQFVLPAWHAAHARELFTAHLRTDPAAYSDLQRRASADDGAGPFPFGPL